MTRLSEMIHETAGMDAAQVLSWAARTFGADVTIASSLGAEDQVIVHMIARSRLEIPVFTLDTGRMFNESYDLIARTATELGVTVKPYLPDASQVEALVASHGINLFYESLELRKRCCHVRKVEPLRRALAGKAAWITGLRRSQSVTRATVGIVEWDDQNRLYKINPLADWTDDDVWGYIRANGVPYHRLHDQGFPSIGCAPCTRAVAPGEDARAGRWWWERPEHRECGLHVADERPPVIAIDRLLHARQAE